MCQDEATVSYPTIIKKQGRKPIWYIYGITEPVYVYDAMSVVELRQKMNEQEYPRSFAADHARQASGEIANHYMNDRDFAEVGLWLVPHPDARYP